MFKFILGGSKKKENNENPVKPNLMANYEDSMFKESFIQIVKEDSNLSVKTIDDVTLVETK